MPSSPGPPSSSLSPGTTPRFFGWASSDIKSHPTAAISGTGPALGHPTVVVLSISLPDRNRSQGLYRRTELWQRIHVIEACRMLFRSIPASSWQPVPQCFIAERLRLPHGSFPPRWERCGCFCCASCGKGWGFCKSSAQKCCHFLANSGLLPCTGVCSSGTGRYPGAGVRWFLQVKPLMRGLFGSGDGVRSHSCSISSLMWAFSLGCLP